MDIYPLDIPSGYGLLSVPRSQWGSLDSLMNYLLIWEAPRREHLYVVSVDVSDGLGLDRSVVGVTRVGTVESPEEEVAQFVSDTTDPSDLAPIVESTGRLYTGSDQQPALVAVECNNHGLVVQSDLQRHWGYDNFFIWQYEDSADPTRRFSTRIGWYTTARTRPMILSRFVKKVKTVDPNTGKADFIINSPFTIEELRDFMIPPGGGVGDACADPTAESAHDDCIMADAIGLHVAQTLQYETHEPVAEQRKRRAEEAKRKGLQEKRLSTQRDWRNTDSSSDEMTAGDLEEEDSDYV